MQQKDVCQGHNGQQDAEHGRDHSAVSSRARRRSSSTSAGLADSIAALREGRSTAARRAQRRTTNHISSSPAPSTAKGMIQARLLKPWVVGAASTVLPYSATKPLMIVSSLAR